MNTRIGLGAALVLGFALLGSSVAVADDAPLTLEQIHAAALAQAKERKEGWAGKLTLGATGSWSQNSNVVGSPDGATVQLGTLIDGLLEHVEGQGTWSSTLKIQEAQARTPVIDSWTKSSDLLDLTSMYFYRLKSLDWVGPYGRVRGTTQAFAGELTKPAGYTVKYLRADGTTPTTTFAGQKFTRLTDPFDPVMFGEAVGLFANPTESTAINVRLKIGAASQQLLTSGGFTLADDAKTPEIEVKQLRNAVQVGAEGEVALDGKIGSDLSWKAKGAVFMPIYTSLANAATGIDALNTDVAAAVSYKLAKWLSVDYVLTAKKVPLVVDKWQVFNGVVLTTGFAL